MQDLISSPPEVQSRSGQWLLEEFDEDVVIIRSATATEPQPPDWRDRLAHYLKAAPSVVVVGAKRTDTNDRIFSMGEFTIHPKGFHHLGRGVESYAFRFPEEVDAICGGVLAMRRDKFDGVGGSNLLDSSLGTLELCLALRAAGGRCVAVPDVVVCDTFDPIAENTITLQEHQTFIAHWGFDWRAPDLDVVRQKHAGTDLLWNVRFFGEAMPFIKYEQRNCMHWNSYAQVDVYRQRADCLAKVITNVTPHCSPPAKILDLGCGDGLFSHLFALSGTQVVGVDPEQSAIDQATMLTKKEEAACTYPGPSPKFIVGLGQSLPFDDASFQTVAMLDVIEHLPNPVAVLREVGRILAPGGHLIVSTPTWQFGGSSDPVYHVCEYTPWELAQQIQIVTGLNIHQTSKISDPYRDIVVEACKDG